MHAVETFATRQFEAEQRELRQARARERATGVEVDVDAPKKDTAIVALVNLLSALNAAENVAHWHGGVEYVRRPIEEMTRAQEALDAMRSPETVEGSR